MSQLASPATGPKRLPGPMGGSPTVVAATENSPVVSRPGIGSSGSSIAKQSDDTLLLVPPSSSSPPSTGLTPSSAPVLSSSASSGEVRSPSKSVDDLLPTRSSSDPSSSSITLQMKITVSSKFLS